MRPQAGRPADSAPGLGYAQAGRHLPKTMPLPPRLTRSVPHFPHFTPLSEELELLGGGPDESTGGEEVQSLALTLTAATAWANPSRSELRFLICKMRVSIFIRLLCGSKQMLSTTPGTWWVLNNSNPKYIQREGEPHNMMARGDVRARAAETSDRTPPCPGTAAGLRSKGPKLRPHHRTGPDAGSNAPDSWSSAPSLIPHYVSSRNTHMRKTERGCAGTF